MSCGSVSGEDDLLRIQRARADVAVDDAEGAEREHGAAGVRDDVALIIAGCPQGFRGVLLFGQWSRTHRPIAELVGCLVEAALHR